MDGGYYQCRVEGKGWPVHRVVWHMFRGEPPEGAVIDHINGDTADNRIANLRATTPFVNVNNRVVADARNRCGLLGVHMKERNGVRRYYARISDGGKSVALGGFSTPELAQAAYFAAKERMKPGFSLASRLL